MKIYTFIETFLLSRTERNSQNYSRHEWDNNAVTSKADELVFCGSVAELYREDAVLWDRERRCVRRGAAGLSQRSSRTSLTVVPRVTFHTRTATSACIRYKGAPSHLSATPQSCSRDARRHAARASNPTRLFASQRACRRPWYCCACARGGLHVRRPLQRDGRLGWRQQGA